MGMLHWRRKERKASIHPTRCKRQESKTNPNNPPTINASKGPGMSTMHVTTTGCIKNSTRAYQKVFAKGETTVEKLSIT